MVMPSSVPVMILRNAILFPQALVPLYVFEPRYRRLLADVLAGGRVLAVARRKPDVHQERAEKIAGLGLVRACVTHDDGTSHLVLQGLSRIELTRTVRYKPYRISQIQPVPSESGEGDMIESLAAELLQVVREKLQDMGAGSFMALSTQGPTGKVSKETAAEVFRGLLEHLNSIQDPEQVVDLVSAALLSDPSQRQLILETRPLEIRMLHLLAFLTPLGDSDDLDVF